MTDGAQQTKGDLIEVLTLTGFDRALTYRVPPALPAVQLGSLVRVPLRNRQELAIVTAVPAPPVSGQAGKPTFAIKNVLQVVQPLPVLTPDLVELLRWMLRYYNASPESVLEAMIPTVIRRGTRPKQRRLIQAVAASEPEVLEALRRRAPRQAKLYDLLCSQTGPVPRLPLLQRLKISDSVCDGLIAKGLAEETREREHREAYDDSLGEVEVVGTRSSDQELTEEQGQAVNDILADIASGAFGVRLLHGVTGSGKTEVYLRVVERVLAAGGGVVFLIPEVALAPQTVARVRARFQDRGIQTVVWHSHLNDGERYDAWHALASGEARVVVGARSAVFAPVRNLRLIVVDEEHEPAYKQEEPPRYHGRDVAVYRARLCQALCLLGSATPSLESLYNVERGKYRIDRMLKRVDDRQLPLLHIVDMRREGSAGAAAGPVSRLLADKLIERFEKREQSILFINRRGFASSLICPDCGHVPECEHCSISLTYHRVDEKLRCHLCGHEEPAPKRCPKCRSPGIRKRGHGTQRIEDIVAKIVPKAKVVRIDADSMSRKNLYRTILNDFRVGKIDLLVGTQMIAKGLDFPNVTLVGLVDADMSLHVEDFRAAERTFQLIVQVSGRAGRGERAGEVVIQTHTPHSPPIQFARQGDFEGFQLEELEQRREFNYPPFRHLVRQLFRSRSLEKLTFYTDQWTRQIEPLLPDSVELRGPAPAPIEKIRDEYRFHLWYFSQSVATVVERIERLRKTFPMDREIAEWIDVDPTNLT